MEPHLAEDEELQKLKEWWRKNGSSITVGIVLGIVAIVGYNGWNIYTDSRAETASLIFSQLRENAAQQNVAAVGQLANELRSEFDSTPYAASGSLIAAGVYHAQGDLDSARDMLRWVMENGDDANKVHLARLRLAYLEVGEGNSEQALELLRAEDEDGYTSHYAEIRGDALDMAGDATGALQAYEQALASLPPNSGYESVLRAKRNSLAQSN
jgi:predicted negative regulator of RcsB-dependent stress response